MSEVDESIWQPERPGDDCFVYIMARLVDGEAQAPIKVGISCNPRERLKQVSRDVGAPLVIVAKFPFWRRRLAYEVEQGFHRACAEFRTTGEWFDLEPQDAIGLMTENLKAFVDQRLGPKRGSFMFAYLHVGLPGYGAFVEREDFAAAYGASLQ